MEKEKRKIAKLDDCITPDGLQVSGMGVLMANSKKTIELLDKIQKFLFFAEKRQKKEFKLIGKLAGLSEQQIENLETEY